MTLSIKELLKEYFFKEDLQNALDEIGETTTGTNSELINRIEESWFKKHRTLKQLLEVLPDDALQDICSDFGLSDKGKFDSLVRRILKNNVVSAPTEKLPSSNVSDTIAIAKPGDDISKMTQRPAYQPHYAMPNIGVKRKKSFRLMIAALVAAVIAIGGLIAAINSGFEFARNVIPAPSTPEPSALLTADLYSSDARVTTSYPYNIRFYNSTGAPENVILQLVVNNVGNAAAQDVNIEFRHYPGNDWFNPYNRTTVSGDVKDSIGADAYQGTFTGETPIKLDYHVLVSPGLFAELEDRNNATVTFTITYDGDQKLLKEYRACFDC